MDEIWDSWDVGLSSVSSVFWLTFKSPLRWDGDPRVTPGPSLEATSVCATNCGCQGCPGGARGVLWVPGGAPAQQHHLGSPFPLSIPRVMQKAERSGGTPPARETPPAPRAFCLLLPQPSQGISVAVAREVGLGDTVLCLPAHSF